MNKVTHFCYSASSQTSAFRLHKSLIAIKCNSQIITGSKSISDKDLIQPKTIKDKFSAVTGILRELFYRNLFYKQCTTYFSLNLGPELFQKRWLKKIYKIKTEIIHLHWIGNGFIPLDGLIKFNKPIVWTMHDLWTITGGCHVIGACKKFETQCGSCPQIQSNKDYDLTTTIFNKKRKIYQKINLTVVVPSTWMESVAKKSPLLENIKIKVIPNATDISIFKPLNKNFARIALNLPTNKKIIAFGAITGISDNNKGFDLLTEAIRKVTSLRDDILLLIFGGDNVSDEDNIFGCEATHIGRLSDNQTLALVYSAADVVAVPSRQESFSMVSSESIACGTPVVAFDATGPRDIIDHKENGYLAESYDSSDFATGILWILEDGQRWKSLSDRARSKAVDFFSCEVVGKQHNDLYDEILKKNGSE